MVIFVQETANINAFMHTDGCDIRYWTMDCLIDIAEGAVDKGSGRETVEGEILVGLGEKHKPALPSVVR